MNKLLNSSATGCRDQRTYTPGQWDGRFSSAVAGEDSALVMVQRILLAEDSAPMREAIWEILARECCGLHWVGHGDHVLAIAFEVMPDTILLDISLPGAGGLSLLPMLREAHPQTNIVMLTNYSEDVYRREAFARGADAYVLKNCANEQLLPAIRAGRFQREDTAPQTDVV